MPRYYFDLSNGHGDIPDEDGSELATFEAAEREAIDTLVAIARDSMPSGSLRSLVIAIRDDRRVLLGTYELSLAIRREGPPAPHHP